MEQKSWVWLFPIFCLFVTAFLTTVKSGETSNPGFIKQRLEHDQAGRRLQARGRRETQAKNTPGCHSEKSTNDVSKTTENDSLQRTEGLDCSMIKDPWGIIPNALKASMCVGYHVFGNMHHSTHSEWKPTAQQKAWMDSLGSQGTQAYIARKQQGLTSPKQKCVRKEYRTLSGEERDRFHNAIIQLKKTFLDGISRYDLFVAPHPGTSGNHFGPGFLPWHREQAFRFENALQEMDPTVCLPYWNSNLDSILGDEAAVNSIMWTPAFVGNGVGDVTTGPFANFTLYNASPGHKVIWRNLTHPAHKGIAVLMPDEAIRVVLNADTNRDVGFFVDPSFQGFHGGVHFWVGGSFPPIPQAPSDPLFFMHHAYIDCIFEKMRQNQLKKGVQVQYDYPNDTEALGLDALVSDGSLQPEDAPQYSLNEMVPFGPLKYIDGLSLEYTEEHYECAPPPTCSAVNPDCGSQALFCVFPEARCAPKLTLGAQCACFENSIPCYGGSCCNGICQEECE